MRRITTKVPFTLAVLTIVAGIAWAANVHLKSKPALSFTDTVPASALELVASGALTGLGNGDVGIVLSANADPTSTCTNPGNGVHQPPGHNPASVVVTGTLGVPGGDIINGNLTFTVVTDPPTTPISGAPDCPNKSWIEDITDLKFTDATITVFQPSGVNDDGEVTSLGPRVFTVNCSLSGSGGKLTASNCQ